MRLYGKSEEKNFYSTAEPSYNETLATVRERREKYSDDFGKDYQECSLVGKRFSHTEIHKT
jgi:hypothetical protein